MSIPMSVTSDQLRGASGFAGQRSVAQIFSDFMPRTCWQPVLIWSASLFQDENGLFFLAAAKYKQAPTKQKMDYIYRHFVGHGRNLPDRAVNLTSAARERTFEIVTGSQTRHFYGGCRADAFDDAVFGLRGYLGDGVNRQFSEALRTAAGTTFTMQARQNARLNEELEEMSRLGMQL